MVRITRLLNFFDRVSKLERIVNVSRLDGRDDEEPQRRESEAYVSVRAQRERGRNVYGDHVFQSRSDNLRRRPPVQNQRPPAAR